MAPFILVELHDERVFHLTTRVKTSCIYSVIELYVTLVLISPLSSEWDCHIHVLGIQCFGVDYRCEDLFV